MHRGPWLSIAITLAVVLVAACLRDQDHTVHPANLSFQANAIFKGMLRVPIESALNRITFVMDLQSGRGGPSTNSEISAKRPPYCGANDRGAPMRALPSPDGLLSISCPLTDTLVIRGTRGEQVAVREFPDHLPIKNVAWSPDSTSIAVLVEQSKVEFFSRQGIFAMLHSLHPVPLVRYRLFLYSPEANVVEELPLPADYIQGGWGAVEGACPSTDCRVH